MIRAFAIILIAVTSAHAQVLEQCSYSIQHPDGTVTQTTEEPSDADGSNQKRFADIKHKEDVGEEGWKGYHTINVTCRLLDNQKLEFNLFVQTENGHISLIHGLTEAACYHALYAADTHRNACSNCSWAVQDGDFKQGQCFK